MAVTFITAVDIDPGTYGSYQEIDVSANVSSLATGIIIRIRNGSSDVQWHARMKGSTDDYYSDTDHVGLAFGFCGIDSNKKLEVKLQRAVTAFELIGYFEGETSFFTNAVDITPSSAQVWESTDISSHTGTDTAIAALILADTNTAGDFGARKNGSTDTYKFDADGKAHLIIGVDATEIMEVWSNSHDVKLLGYMTHGVSMNTNSTDIKPVSNNTWTTQNLSASATGAIVLSGHTTNIDPQEDWGVRQTGSGLNWFGDFNEAMGFGICNVNASQQIDTYIEDTTDTVFRLLGEFRAIGTGGTVPPLAMHHYRGRRK